MNLRMTIPVLLAAWLSGCDSSSTTAGTSSETVTGLQILADSLSTLRLPRDLPQETAARGAAFGKVEEYVNRNYAYGIGNDGQGYAYASRTSARLEGGSLAVRDTLRWIDEAIDLERRTLTLPLEGRDSVAASESEGMTRAGFRFSWRVLTASDRRALDLEAQGIGGSGEGLLYTFEGGWNLVIPSGTLVPQPVLLHKGMVVARLEPNGGGGAMPILDFSRWRIRGIDGIVYTGRPLSRLPDWASDSLGVHFGRPALDSAGTAIRVPYRWRLFPGTVAAAGSMNPPNLWVVGASDSLVRVEGFGLPSDAGSSTAIIRGAIRDGRSSPLHLATGWFSRSDSGSVDALDFWVDVPGFAAVGAAGSSAQVFRRAGALPHPLAKEMAPR